MPKYFFNLKRAVMPLLFLVAVTTATAQQSLVGLNPIIDNGVCMRDPEITLGGDGNYYMALSKNLSTAQFGFNIGIELWKSSDLLNWTCLGTIWSLEKDAIWCNKSKYPDVQLWAPEIHFIKNNYWITYTIAAGKAWNDSVSYLGNSLLKSKSGSPTGPYADVKTDGPLADWIDASLFEDTDGKVYYLWQNKWIRQMNDDMTGFVTAKQDIKCNVGFEGVFMYKIKGVYYLLAADNNKGGYKGYNCMAASSTTLMGPYSESYVALQDGGHNGLFTDKNGQLWATTMHSRGFSERPSIVKMQIDESGKLKPLEDSYTWVTNPGFETGSFSPWSGIGTSVVSRSNTHSGSYAAEISGLNSGFKNAKVRVFPNTTYTLKVWGKVGAHRNAARLYVKNYGGTEVQSDFTRTNYTQNTVTFTTGASNTICEIGVLMTTAGTCYIDDFTLIKGSDGIKSGTSDSEARNKKK